MALDPEDHARLPQVAELLSLAHVPFKVIPSLFELAVATAIPVVKTKAPFTEMNGAFAVHDT